MTLSLDADIYVGLHEVIGAGKISQFLEALARPYVLKATLPAQTTLNPTLAAGYAAAAADEAQEAEANEWTEALWQDGFPA